MTLATEPAATAAATSWEAVRDHFLELDQRLMREVERRRRNGTSQNADHLLGLVLQESEIIEILSAPWPTSEAPTECNIPIQTEIAEKFQLSWAEEQTLLLCLACELNARYGKVMAYLQDDITCRQPSIGLAAQLFWGRDQLPAARAAFLSEAPLLRHRLLETCESHKSCALTQRTLRAGDRITGLLLAADETDAALREWVDLWIPELESPTPVLPSEVSERTLQLAASCFANGVANVRPVFHLTGRAGAGRESLARYVCGGIGLPLLVADVRRLPPGSAGVEALWRLGREAVLQPAAIFVAHFDDLLDESRHEQRDAFLQSEGHYSPLTFLAGDKPWNPPLFIKQRLFVEVECGTPDASARLELWNEGLQGVAHSLSEADLREVAAQFNFTRGQIHEALLIAQARSAWRHQPPLPVGRVEVFASCRAQATPHLGDLARKVETGGNWDDLVLPDAQKQQLQEIVAQSRQSQTVLHEWGFNRKFSYGYGVSALFEGTSGTGKTMAAGIIASEPGLDLYKIDLSGVVNKYIGETEKNLSRIFDEARDSNTVLFFDEAEALFARRAEIVKDANDRYAGIENRTPSPTSGDSQPE